MKTLVIMAAGLGSRFSGTNIFNDGHGGEKQTSFIDNNNNCLFHLAIEDAISAGFKKVILIIRKKDQGLFDKLLENKFEGRINIEFAYQEMDEYISKGIIPADRTKPLGTVQAILSAKDLIDSKSFAVVNADDYYGTETFKIASKLMDESTDSLKMVSFLAKNTLSEIGPVKRGVCTLNDKGEVTNIQECKIWRDETGKIMANPVFEEVEPFAILDETEISMQFFVFPTSILKDFEEHLNLTMNSESFDKMKGELILVETINYIQAKTGIKLISTPSPATWMGLTYKEDLDDVKSKIKKLYETGSYKNINKIS